MSIFNMAAVRGVQKSAFDLSHERKMSIKFDNLYPILLQEVIPSDSFQVNSEIMLRMAPMIAPVMHRVNVKVDYFFVPNRLVWNDWEDFITGGAQGDLQPVAPTLTIDDLSKTRFVKGSLADYFGIPITDGITIPSEGVTQISALPFRAYQKIYNEYYRDQNLEEEVPIDLNSGSDTTPADITQLRKRAWEKDYFTSALPWPQRGGEAEIPLGAANIDINTTSVNYKTSATTIDDGTFTAISNIERRTDGSINATQTTPAQSKPIGIDNIDSIDVQGTAPVDATTINDLRKANKLQEWLETSARGGARYIEQIWSHFRQKSSDARLQRPEYLGGSKQPVVISEVLNTTGITSGDEGGPQGEMAGHGISVGKSNRFRKKFEEHGFVIGIMCVIPKTTYQQGLDRLWNRTDKFDYPWPSFAHLGEQEVKQQEIYQDYLSNTLAQGVFGYQQRYAEYKYSQSSVHGDFRDNLQFWHLGRYFTNAPALNTQFVQANTRTDIFAVQDETIDNMYCQIYNSVKAIRPLPYQSIPSL